MTLKINPAVISSDYTLQAGDFLYDIMEVGTNSGDPITISIPNQSGQRLQPGATLSFVLVGSVGVLFEALDTAVLDIASSHNYLSDQWKAATLYKRNNSGSGEWVLFGPLAAAPV